MVAETAAKLGINGKTYSKYCALVGFLEHTHLKLQWSECAYNQLGKLYFSLLYLWVNYLNLIVKR